MPRTTRQTPQAESLLARLRTAAKEVPEDARRFHELHERLVQRLDAATAQRFAWGRRDELSDLDDDVLALETAVPWMAKLFARVSSVRRKVLRLRARTSEGATAEESGWIGDRCTGWEAELERVGATLPQQAAVSQATKSIGDLADRVALHDDAVEWLVRARRVLAALDAHDLSLEGAPLAAALPEIGAGLREEPTRGAIDELAERVRGLEERVDRQPKEAPPEYADADKVLAVVEDWHRHLGELGQLSPDAVRDLGDVRERLDVARRNWRREGAQSGGAMLLEAREMAETTRGGARQRRAEALDLLRDRVRHLGQVAEAGSDLAENLVTLGECPAETGAAHVAWWRDLERLEGDFLADAEMAREELSERRLSRRDELAAEISELESMPRGAAERAGLFQVRSELHEIGRGREPIEVLEDLRRIDRISETVREVALRIEEEGRALRERVATLRERDLALRRAAGRAGTRARRLGHRVRALEDPDSSPSHEETDAEVRALERDLADEESAFAGRCAERVRELTERWHRVVGVLEGADADLDPEPLPPPPSDTTPPERAAAVVESLRETLDELVGAAVEVCTTLEARRSEILSRLDAIGIESLSPSDRDDALGLRADLLGEPAPDGDPVERIEALLPVLENGEELLARFARHEQDARRLRAVLTRRFGTLRSDGLLDDSGAPAERLEALLRGVPERPVSWPDALGQLHHARRLLDRLEGHARRLAVADLSADVTVLERRRHRERGGETGRLLAELEALDPHELPPASLRQKIHRRARTLLDSERRSRA